MARQHHPSLTTRMPRSARWAVFVLVAFALVACGDKAGKKSATQVAAKVGSDEISVHQINFVLARTNTANVAPENAQRLRQEVLEKLIDQQLAVDQAIDKKLDRSPEVVSQLEAARREVLARAYVQQLAGSLPKPTTEEVQKYFNDNPPLFSERRIFNLQELVVPATAGAEVAEQVKAQVAAGKSMDEIATGLKARNVKFGGNSATRAAEQIPLELLKTVHALKDGQTTVISNAQGITVLRLVSSQSAPVTEAAALPRIEQFLANRRGAEAVTAAIKDLRAKTTITYMGDFASGANGAATPAQPIGAITADPAAAATPAAAAAPAPATTATPPPPPVAPVTVDTTVDDKTKAAIEKGVKGLK
ncbi:MAG: EpsD family peptidyl-prolyl cis-trans isomerase [Burkholderiaceae bacterium]